MAKDLTGKNIATKKNDAFVDLAIIVDIGTDVDETIEDDFVDATGETTNLAIHTPLRVDGTQGAPDGSVWRKQSSATALVIDTSGHHINSDGSTSRDDDGYFIDGKSSDGDLYAMFFAYVNVNDLAVVSPAFRYTSPDGTGFKIGFTSTTIILYKEDPVGTKTSLATLAYVLINTRPILIRINLQGPDIKVYIDGDLKITYTSDYNQYATYHGMWLNIDEPTLLSDANVATARMDMFRFDSGIRVSDRPYTMRSAVEGIKDIFTVTGGSNVSLADHTPDTSKLRGTWITDVGSEFDVVASSGNYIFWDADVMTNVGDGHVIQSGFSDGHIIANITPFSKELSRTATGGSNIGDGRLQLADTTQSWTTDEWVGDEIVIVGTGAGTFTITDNGSNFLRYTASLPTVDAESTYTIRSANRKFGLRFRYTGKDGTGLYVDLDSSGNTVCLIKMYPHATEATVLANHSQTIASGTTYSLKIAYYDENIKVYLDDVEIISTTSTFNQYKTWVGVGAQGTGNSRHVAENAAGKIANFYYYEPHTYTSLIPEGGIGQITEQQIPGGGLATISGAQIAILNQGLFSSRMDAMNYLSGRSVTMRMVAIDGNEDISDAIEIFTGRVVSATWNPDMLTIACEDDLLRDLVAFPRDVVDIGLYPNAPASNFGQVVPVVFGDWTNDLFNDSTVADSTRPTPNLAPLMLTDIFERRYVVHGENNTVESNYSGGVLSGINPVNASPVFYDQSNEMFLLRPTASGSFVVSADAQNNNGFYADSNLRTVIIYPIRESKDELGVGNNEFTTAGDTTYWSNCIDQDGNTYVSIPDDTSDAPDALVVAFGVPTNYGVIDTTDTDIMIVGTFHGTVQALWAQLKSYKKVDGASASNKSTYYVGSTSRGVSATAETQSDWPTFDDLQLMLISIRPAYSAGAAPSALTNIYDLHLEIRDFLTYEGQPNDVRSFPCFARVTGYTDTKARYATQDCFVTGRSVAGVLTNPALVFQAILRDRYMGMGLAESRLNLGSTFTDSGQNTRASATNVQIYIYIDTAHGIVAGDLIRINSVAAGTGTDEEMYVTGVQDHGGVTDGQLNVIRGVNGSTSVTHQTATDVYKSSNSTSFGVAEGLLDTYKYDFVLTDFNSTPSATREWINRFMRQTHLLAYVNFQNKWSVDFLSEDDVCQHTFTLNSNISVTNPTSVMSAQTDSFTELEPSPIFNEFFFKYGWNHILGRFTKFVAATGRYLVSGVNGSIPDDSYTFTSAGTNFTTEDVVVGNILYVRSGTGATRGNYTISTVGTTTLTLSTYANTSGATVSDIEYYVGPYVDKDCVDSFLKHRDITAYPDDELNFIQDDTTASSVLAKKIAYHSDTKAKIQFQTFLNAVNCELRDLCYVDHDFLPQELRKRDSTGVIYGPDAAGDIDADDSPFWATVEVGYDFSVNDIIIVDDEVMKVTSFPYAFGTGTFGNAKFGNYLTVTRGFAGSVAAAHVRDSIIYKLTTKWEILSISINPQQVNMYALNLREV